MKKNKNFLWAAVYKKNERRHGMKRTVIIGIELLILGALLIKPIHSETEQGTGEILLHKSQKYLQKSAEEMYMPKFTYQTNTENDQNEHWMKKKAMEFIPAAGYIEQKNREQLVKEDEETIAKILEEQANDENSIDENGNLVGDDSLERLESMVAQDNSPIDMSIERLRDFNYLMGTFYTVDSSTMAEPEEFNVDELLGKSMKIDTQTPGPKVLIYHTHSQEAFADSVPGDPSTTIVGVGDYLCELLNKKGIETIHDKGVYDIIDGKLDRSMAYEVSMDAAQAILDANPSIEVIIDLHRDGVAEGTHLVTEVNGKPAAKIMYFNGLSKTRINGEITYLSNPYIQDNLALSLQMELATEKMYPGFARRIYLRGYRYNQHLLPKALLIEAGAQTNTVQEMKNAMEALSDVLQYVLTN